MLPNSQTNTLHLLAGSSTTTALDAARALLASGANASAKGDEGLTPLHVACAYDCLAMAQLLMHYGADPQAEDAHGRTPFSMATGNTQRFLQRVLAKSTREQRSIIRRIFSCHAVVQFAHTRFVRSLRKRMRNSLAAIGYRRDRMVELPAATVTTSSQTGVLSVIPTGKSVASSSRTIPASYTIHPGYPSSNMMPQSSTSQAAMPTAPPRSKPRSNSTPARPHRREKGSGRNIPAAETSSVCHTAEAPSSDLEKSKNGKALPTFGRKDKSAPSSPTMLKRCVPSAPPIEEMPSDDISKWLSEKDSTLDTTQGTDIYLTADESFDMKELQRRVEQMKIGDPITSPNVDDGQLRKIRRLNDTQLRAELKKVGIIAGPMCARTRGMYEKKLLVTRREVADTKGVRYSRQLEMAMIGMLSPDAGRILDDKVREEYELAGVTAFCYLLLDPRKITGDVDSLDLKTFIPAIFYVGKGTKARPLAHLIEAKKEREANSPKLVSNMKLKRIDSIWGSGSGVLCLQINHSVSDDEAFVREAALIEAIRLENLTNMKGGEWRGESKTWTLAMKAELGTYQLQRALGVLKMEGLRPIKPEALPESLLPYAPKKIP